MPYGHATSAYPSKTANHADSAHANAPQEPYKWYHSKPAYTETDDDGSTQTTKKYHATKSSSYPSSTKKSASAAEHAKTSVPQTPSAQYT